MYSFYSFPCWFSAAAAVLSLSVTGVIIRKLRNTSSLHGCFLQMLLLSNDWYSLNLIFFVYYQKNASYSKNWACPYHYFYFPVLCSDVVIYVEMELSALQNSWWTPWDFIPKSQFWWKQANVQKFECQGPSLFPLLSWCWRAVGILLMLTRKG